MKNILIERNIVILLFIVVLVTFSFAERDSKKIEKIYTASQLIKKQTLTQLETAARLSKAKATGN